MNKQVYQERRKYEKYDSEHYMLYLNEEIAEYIPPVAMPSDLSDIAPVLAPVSGYSYTGEEVDGGTLIEAKEATYNAFVNGLIRKQYPVSAVEAIQSNMLISLSSPEHARADEFRIEWERFQEYREECKGHANALLNN